MKVEIRESKSVAVKSNIPSIDYVVNPYTGCQHGCIYCYAEFMIRFTGHKGEKWGEFLDVKDLPLEKVKPHKYDGKTLLLSSVTDPYLPLEQKYGNTRKVLNALVGTTAKIIVLTKSHLVQRDLNLFKKFDNIEVGVSLCSLDEKFSRMVEPHASSPAKRLKALEKVYNSGVPSYAFISPYFPEITDFKAIIDVSRGFVDSFRFENLNFRPHNVPRILHLVKKLRPDLLPLYKSIKYGDRAYWNDLESYIRDYCESEKLDFKIEFHHGGFSKS